MDCLGVGAGMLAAFFQALSYPASRWFIHLPMGSSRRLLAISHVWMGIGALGLGLFLGVGGFRGIGSYGWAACGATGFYLVGQMGLFMALRRAESSDIVPLLGMKVILLALISVVFAGQRLTGWQWVSVVLSVGAVFLLWERRGRIPALAWAGVGWAVLGYSLSDLSIKALVQRLSVYGPKAPLAGVTVSYLLGAVMAPLWLDRESLRYGKLWAAGLPFSVLWFLGMIFLYITFDRVGVVLGNILQSTRGVMAVGLGVLLARAGFEAVESRQSMSVTVRRWAAALAMTTAIVLYFV